MNSALSIITQLLTEQNLDALLISSVTNIIYLTNFSYFSSEERDAFLVITKKHSFIITSPLYSEAVKQQVKDFELREYGTDRNLTKILAEIVKSDQIETIGIEAHNLTVLEHTNINTVVKEIKHVNLSSLRVLKEQDEILNIQKACSIGDDAFAMLIKQLKLGMTEKDVAFRLEWLIRNQSAEIAFRPIVAFAENAAIPHHKPGNRKLRKNEAVLLDFGVKYENYCSDMSRTVFFGKATDEEKKIYKTVLEAQNLAVDYLKNYSTSTFSPSPQSSHIKGEEDIYFAQVDMIARKYIISQGFPSIPHPLGHGIGLEVHESPRLSPSSKETLQPGMVFSIEPGIYLPNKFGVRIEDLFVIEKKGLKQLTNAPKELIEISN